MKVKFSMLCMFFALVSGFGQAGDITTSLYESYEKYKETSLDKRRTKHHQIMPLLEQIGKIPGFEVKQLGRSIEGRPIFLVSIGQGDTDVFLWSQMHGNEPTATLAIFDILNFLKSEDYKDEKEEILSNTKLHFLPMLNPDGAEIYRRRNALGIDINRDALRLQSPEGQILKRVRDSLEADFGFNLHDQSTYYNAERTEKPATISYLAPAYNYEKEINDVRANAMKVIVFMNNIIQEYAPGQVGRYNDDFEPRAFGDNIQKWGTSAILIESGGYAKDLEKQEIRKLNYVSILSAIYTIAKGNYKDISLDSYEKIPENDRKLFDLKIAGVTYELLGKDYIIDLGIQRPEVDFEDHLDFWYSSRIMDQGDLSTYYGYQSFDASGYKIKEGAVYPKTLNSAADLNQLDFVQLMKSGYLFLRMKDLPEGPSVIFPMHLIAEKYKMHDFHINVGVNPSFLMEKDGNIAFAVINGFLIDLSKDSNVGLSEFASQKGNAMILR